jgi:hypothetical protein
MSSLSTAVHVYHVAGRGPGTGPVLAVFTDGPTDLAVVTTAAALAADTRTLLFAAAAVPTAGFSLNSLLHRARARRTGTDSIAIVARVTPILTTAGVAWLRTTLPVPAGTDPAQALPVTALRELAGRLNAAVVVTAAALTDPTGNLRPATATATAATATELIST